MRVDGEVSIAVRAALSARRDVEHAQDKGDALSALDDYAPSPVRACRCPGACGGVRAEHAQGLRCRWRQQTIQCNLPI